MSKRITYHVVPDTKGVARMWKVELAGSEKATRIFHTQKEAIEYGMVIASSHYPHGQLLIHGVDGKFEDERTYGEDPERYPN